MNLQTEFSFDDEKKEFSISKKIRIIELFAGYHSQAMALKMMGIDFEAYKSSEWQTVATSFSKEIFNPDDKKDYSQDMSDDEVIQNLISMGISIDDEKPVDEKTLKRKGSNWCRKTYNDFRSTNNLGSITNIKGGDLGIGEKDKYVYVMTYSFPCQRSRFICSR